jgi:hypothetical protein
MARAIQYKGRARCVCGQVEIGMLGAPITSAVCYCDDCQEGARQLSALPGAPPITDADGGTPYLVYRKDRVECLRGSELLHGYKIRPASATVRLVARCCNSAMLLRFEDGKHWVDIYRARAQDPVPPLRMRVCTRFRHQAGEIPGDLPAYSGYPLRLLVRLVTARVAMWLRP